MIETRSVSKQLNETLFEQLHTPGMEKQALDSVNDFTRTKLRQDGFFRKIMPPVQVSDDDLDRQVDTDKPVIVIDREPDSPASITVPFGTLPMSLYIRGPRYRVMFDRILSPRFTKDSDELRTWVMDIRQVLSDNAIKDMMVEEDTKFITAVNAALGGAPDVENEISGVPQWETISGGITRDTVQESFKTMPRTPSHLSVDTILINNVTVHELQKWGFDEMGGDFSQEVLKNGFSEMEFMNKKWVITINRDLVPDDTMYHFADPKFIGKSYVLEDTTMYIERKAFMLEFFAYETTGCSFGFTSGLTRADFT